MAPTQTVWGCLEPQLPPVLAYRYAGAHTTQSPPSTCACVITLTSGERIRQDLRAVDGHFAARSRPNDFGAGHTTARGALADQRNTMGLPHSTVCRSSPLTALVHMPALLLPAFALCPLGTTTPMGVLVYRPSKDFGNGPGCPVNTLHHSPRVHRQQCCSTTS